MNNPASIQGPRGVSLGVLAAQADCQQGPVRLGSGFPLEQGSQPNALHNTCPKLTPPLQLPPEGNSIQSQSAAEAAGRSRRSLPADGLASTADNDSQSQGARMEQDLHVHASHGESVRRRLLVCMSSAQLHGGPHHDVRHADGRWLISLHAGMHTQHTRAGTDGRQLNTLQASWSHA